MFGLKEVFSETTFDWACTNQRRFDQSGMQETVALKPVLKTAWRFLLPSSRRIAEPSGTSVARLNIPRQHLETSHSWDREQAFTDSSRCVLTSWFGLPRDAGVTWQRKIQLTMAGSSTPFSSGSAASITRCRTGMWNMFSVSGRYTINCEIPPIENSQIDRAEEARCTLSVSCLTDLDYSVVFVHWVDVFLQHVHRTSKRF